jgi:hypothetical protein
MYLFCYNVRKDATTCKVQGSVLAPSIGRPSELHLVMLGVKAISLLCCVNFTLYITPELTHLAWTLIK